MDKQENIHSKSQNKTQTKHDKTKTCKNPKCTCSPCNCESDGKICTCGLDEYEKRVIDGLIIERDSAKKQAEDNLNRAKYEKAEFENYKKRERMTVENSFNEGRIFVLINVLPVLDSLTEALKVIKAKEDREGIEILHRKLESILLSIGLEEIDAKPGVKFDPHIHNSVAVGKADGTASGVILEEWQKGYKLEGRVIRPSTVKVSE